MNLSTCLKEDILWTHLTNLKIIICSPVVCPPEIDISYHQTEEHTVLKLSRINNIHDLQYRTASALLKKKKKKKSPMFF